MRTRKFDKAKFSKGDEVEYYGETYQVLQVDLTEKLFGIIAEDGHEDSDICWVRCEHCVFVPVVGVKMRLVPGKPPKSAFNQLYKTSIKSIWLLIWRVIWK